MPPSPAATAVGRYGMLIQVTLRLVSRVTVLLLVTGAVAAAMASAASDAAAPKRTGTIAFIRFSSHTPGPFGGRLFDIRADGSGLRPLTPLGTKVSGYAWSPDGRLIAYHDAQGSLWLVRPDGSGRKLLLSTSRMQTVDESWSPDGSRIAITSLGPKGYPWKGCCTRLRLYVVPVDGSAPVSLPGGKHIDYRVSWSPRGDVIYYGNGGVWAIRPDGTGRRQVSPVGAAGSLSAGGAQLVFGVGFRPRNGGTDRYHAFGVVNADGTGYHVVTTHAYNEYGEVWSPSGRRILYGRADGKGIYVIGSDGRNNHRVTGDSPPAADWGALAWSPDGGSIVYDTGGYENTDLYVIGVDGRGKFQLTNTPDVDIGPSWVAR
jgi:Tol biopolymer transport system component